MSEIQAILDVSPHTLPDDKKQPVVRPVAVNVHLRQELAATVDRAADLVVSCTCGVSSHLTAVLIIDFAVEASLHSSWDN
jgi:predicted protein tyrosine phosphatase